MPSNNWEKFSEAYLTATSEQREFLDSGLIPQYVRNTLQKLSVAPGIIRELVLFCSSKILTIGSDTDLQTFIVQNNLDTQKITAVVNAALSLFITDSDYDRLSHQTITHDVRKNLFTGANDTQKYLAFSNEGKLALADILSAFAINDIDSRKKVVILITDIIFGFYKVADTVPLIQQELGADARTAALLGADVLGFLAPLSDPNFVVPKEEGEEGIEVAKPSPEPTIHLAPVSSYAVSQSQPQATAPTYQPAPTPAVAPELHTMAMDANAARSNYQPTAEATYSSEQPVTRQPLSDLPSYTNGATQPQNSTPVPPIEPPRWGN